MVLGVISDTHGCVDPFVYEAFDGVDAIVHGGDIGGAHVIPELEAIAPVIACSGNVDGFELSGFPTHARGRVGHLEIGATHVGIDRGRLIPEVERWIAAEALHLCVFGHSHEPFVGRSGGALVVNPGSAGPKRFRLPRAVARVTVAGDVLDAEILTFG